MYEYNQQCGLPPKAAMSTQVRQMKARSTSEHEQLGGRRGYSCSTGSTSMTGISTVKALRSLGGSHDAGCMEQLLVHCMMAIENNDATSAQQLMWVLNNTVSTEGDPNQRVTAYFLRALISRASRMSTPSSCYTLPTPGRCGPGQETLAHEECGRDANTQGVWTGLGVSGQVWTVSANYSTAGPISDGWDQVYKEGPPQSTRLLSAIELAGFVDLTPWHRFGFSASNGAILEALQGKHSVHIVDFSITHCMQWPTLIEALSTRLHGPPPHVRLTVHSARPHVPPLPNMSFEEVGMKLTLFARSKKVPFQFNVLPQEISQLTPSCIDVQEGEILVINCQMRARYIYDEAVKERHIYDKAVEERHIYDKAVEERAAAGGGSPRVQFMRWIRAVKPNMVTFVEEDAEMGSKDMVSRVKAAFNYLWIPFDAMDTFLPRESKERMEYEGDIGRKIENIIACEGEERVERLESKERWMHRLRNTSNLQSIQFSEAVVAEVKSMLEEHAAGWGLKKEGDSLLLTWKGHNVVFATACVPLNLGQ